MLVHIWMVFIIEFVVVVVDWA